MSDGKRWAGSRMHVLDWLDGGGFTASLNAMLRPTGFLAPESGTRMPGGWHQRDEARLGKDCGTLIKPDLNAALLNWWLAKPGGANVPNWDLACTAISHGGTPSLILGEAKAHEAEFKAGRPGKTAGNPENDARIGAAIEEARTGLARHSDKVGISKDRWYQFSNRVAFAWKLAASGIPTVLVYVGFTEDEGMARIGEPLRDDAHWRGLVCSTLDEAGVFPASLWEREIDCGAAPLWMLTRTRRCPRQSRWSGSLEGFTVGEDGLPSDKEFWADELSNDVSPFDFDDANGDSR